VDVREIAVVIERGRRVLLVQRPDAGRWAGMWEFPHATVANGKPRQPLRRLAAELTGIAIDPGAELMTLRHSVTHHRITMTCFRARYRTGRFRSDYYARGLWLFPSQVACYPVSVPQRKLARRLVL
jgi:A/G-specific adenine glycosylase